MAGEAGRSRARKASAARGRVQPRRAGDHALNPGARAGAGARHEPEIPRDSLCECLPGSGSEKPRRNEVSALSPTSAGRAPVPGPATGITENTGGAGPAPAPAPARGRGGW